MASPRSARVPRGRAGGPSRGYMALVGIVGVVIVLLIVGLLTRWRWRLLAESLEHRVLATEHGRTAAHSRAQPHTGARPAHARSRIWRRSSCEPTGAVYVCLIGDRREQAHPRT